jgi:hypothetical protein
MTPARDPLSAADEEMVRMFAGPHPTLQQPPPGGPPPPQMFASVVEPPPEHAPAPIHSLWPQPFGPARCIIRLSRTSGPPN